LIRHLAVLLLVVALAAGTADAQLVCPGGTIALTGPQNGATVNSPVSFAWNGVAGTTAYRVWFELPGAPPMLAARVSHPLATAPLPSGTGEWFVEAVFDRCPSIYSVRQSLTVRAAATCANNTAPVLVSPIATPDGPAVVSSAVQLRWNPVPGAIAYRVLLGALGASTLDEAGFTKETTITRQLEPGIFAWAVAAIFEGCPPILSTPSAFRVEPIGARCGTATPAILTPARGSNVTSPVRFSWTAVSNALSYRIYASLNQGELFLLGETTETSLERALPPGIVGWSVEATFKACPSTHAPPSGFSVARAPSCSSERPRILAPAPGAENVSSPVTFSWTAVANAIRYVVIVRGEDGAPVPVGDTSATQLSTILPPAPLEWWVVAFRAGCDPVQSDPARFTVSVPSGCDVRRPLLNTPLDSSFNVPSPVNFSWTPVPGATSYKLWAAVGVKEPMAIATTTTTEVRVDLPPGPVRWFVEAALAGCPPVASAPRGLVVGTRSTVCSTPEAPLEFAPGQVLADTPFRVRWSSTPNTASYELQESSTPDFAAPRTISAPGESWNFSRGSGTYYYRVRAVSGCADDRGPYSDVVRVNVLSADVLRGRAIAEAGVQTSVVQRIDLPGSATPQAFSARADEPWITVSPASGTIPPEGLTLTVTADPRALFLGANMGTVRLTYGSGGKSASNGTPPSSVPVSVNLVTPVTPGGRNTPPPDALIIPAVAHAAGANNSQFETDVRVVNTSTQSMTYTLNFTPSGVDGTEIGSSTTIQVEPGASLALNDLLSTFFGTAPGENALGMLEIRPASSATSSSAFTGTSTKLATVASSRTYNATANGTLGQFIPAVPFASFIGKSQVLSLQQLAESAAYRTNFGLVEASGQSAEVVMRVFDRSNTMVRELPFSLKPSEHMKLDRLLAVNQISLDEGRVEVEVLSETGKVSAYASTVDNLSGDPLLVPPVLKSVSATRYVIPGIAYFSAPTVWRSDVRLFNAAATAVTATVAYAGQTAEVTINAGEVKAFDNILNSLFGIATDSGGAILVTTPASSSLIATARTYAQTEAGTYGQFIPGVTTADSIGLGDRTLHVVQLESSENFRTNVAVFETSGQAVTAEVTLILPDSKISPKVQIPLAANGFYQFPLAAFGLTDAVYNARVSVKAVSGSGKLSAYGSIIDNLSRDPTYVPAQ
jgi:hypothetical protein